MFDFILTLNFYVCHRFTVLYCYLNGKSQFVAALSLFLFNSQKQKKTATMRSDEARNKSSQSVGL